MKIGLFFGSFDPIHIGHIEIVTHALNTKIVDKVIIVPAYHNPWKEHSPAPFKDRYHMCALAFNGIPNVHISDVEDYYATLYGLDNLTTFGILERLKQDYDGDDISILTTSETFNEIPKWANGNEIISRNSFVIFLTSENLDWTTENKTKKSIVIKSLAKLEVSSTLIRSKSLNGDELTPLVPLEVSKYIKNKQLYKWKISHIQ